MKENNLWNLLSVQKLYKLSTYKWIDKQKISHFHKLKDKIEIQHLQFVCVTELLNLNQALHPNVLQYQRLLLLMSRWHIAANKVWPDHFWSIWPNTIPLILL